MAKKSPKAFAERIRRRNKALLKKLMLLEPYLDKTFDEVPDAIWREVLKRTSHGCPHCGGCNKCLWTRAAHRGFFEHAACSTVKFDGVNLDYFQAFCFEDGKVTVNYSTNCESIFVDGHTSLEYLRHEQTFHRESWEKAVRFVKAHIEWTKLPCWGSEYKKKPIKRLGD